MLPHSQLRIDIHSAMNGFNRHHSELISFVSRNGFLLRGKASIGVELTHTLMDGCGGGRICLPDSATDGFMNAYGTDLSHGVSLYVIERRTSIFKMHFDLDFKIMHDDAVVEDVLNDIHRATSRFISPGVELDRETWAIVCAVLDESTGNRKTSGIHIIFPWLLVDTHQALWIRSSVICSLRHNFSTLESDWDSVVDVAVLTSNGFRMVGSDKCRDCASCHNSRDRRPFCADCSCQGRLPEGKIYWPWLTIPEKCTQELKSELLGNKAHAVLMCSTRVPLSRQHISSRFVIPVGAPPPSIRKKLTAAEGRLQDKEYKLNEAAPSNLRLRTEPMDIGPDLKKALLETLAHHNPLYASLEIISIDRLLGVRYRASFSVKVRGYGCRLCQNKQAEHTQQTVYFIINRSGISQRCFSRKPVQRRFGFCEKYVSPPTCLLPSLICILYPDALDIPLSGQSEALEDDISKAPKRARTGLDIAEKLWGKGATSRTQ